MAGVWGCGAGKGEVSESLDWWVGCGWYKTYLLELAWVASGCRERG